MKKICWIISLINVLKDKFSSIYWIMKQRDSENTILEGKSFHLWLGKNLNEKVNHTPHQMKTPLRIENCQQKKTLSQVAHKVFPTENLPRRLPAWAEGLWKVLHLWKGGAQLSCYFTGLSQRNWGISRAQCSETPAKTHTRGGLD